MPPVLRAPAALRFKRKRPGRFSSGADRSAGCSGVASSARRGTSCVSPSRPLLLDPVPRPRERLLALPLVLGDRVVDLGHARPQGRHRRLVLPVGGLAERELHLAALLPERTELAAEVVHPPAGAAPGPGGAAREARPARDAADRAEGGSRDAARGIALGRAVEQHEQGGREREQHHAEHPALRDQREEGADEEDRREHERRHRRRARRRGASSAGSTRSLPPSPHLPATRRSSGRSARPRRRRDDKPDRCGRSPPRDLLYPPCRQYTRY